MMENTVQAPIRHLVLSGGVIYGFSFYGLLKRLHQEGWMDMRDIETVFATSAGSIVSTLLSVWRIYMRDTTSEEGGDPTELQKMPKQRHRSCRGHSWDWSVLDNYLIERPWHDVFRISLDTLFHAFDNCGVFNIKFMEDLFRPVFASCDLDLDTLTMSEFYERTGVEHHFFTVNMTRFQTVDISHHTHPQWRVVDAVYASSCAPGMFSPHYQASEKDLYVDGGVLIHYPILPCLQWCDAHDVSRNQVLGINLLMGHDGPKESATLAPSNMNLMEYFQMMLRKIFNTVSRAEMSFDEESLTHHQIDIRPTTSILHFFNDFIAVSKSREKRMEFVALGAHYADQFLAVQIQNRRDIGDAEVI